MALPTTRTLASTALEHLADHIEAHGILNSKGAANGLASLDAAGRVPIDQIPGQPLGDTFTAATEAAMLALPANNGDMAIRTDFEPDQFYILTSNSPATLADWKQVSLPGTVASVDGKVGAVVLSASYAGLDASGRVLPTQGRSTVIPVATSTTDAAANTTAIQAALDAAAGVGSGRPTAVRLLVGPDNPGLVPINGLLTLSKVGVWLEAEAYGTTGGGCRLVWQGAAAGEMVRVTAANAGVRNLVLDANGTAATCIRYNNGEKQGYEDLECANFTGEGMVVGNGIANNNGFMGKGSLYLRGKAGSVPLVVNAQATEDINFETVFIGMAAGNTAAMLRCVDLVNGAVSFEHLTFDDDFMVDYAMRVQAGSFGINDLISECGQTLTSTLVGRSRGSYILRGDLRSCNVQTGQYAMEFQAAGDNSAPYLLGGIRVNRKAAAANTPNVRVNGCTVFAPGVYFTTSDAAAAGTFVPSGTGFTYWFSDNGGLINGPQRWDAAAGITKLLGLVAGVEHDLLRWTAGGSLIVGSDTLNLSQWKALTSVSMWANNVECLRVSNDNAGRVYIPCPKVLLSASTDLEIDGPLNHDGTTVGFYGVTPITRPTAPTAADAASVDATYGAEEAGVINNMRIRIGELEGKLRNLGLIT